MHLSVTGRDGVRFSWFWSRMTDSAVSNFSLSANLHSPIHPLPPPFRYSHSEMVSRTITANVLLKTDQWRPYSFKNIIVFNFFCFSWNATTSIFFTLFGNFPNLYSTIYEYHQYHWHLNAISQKTNADLHFFSICCDTGVCLWGK